MERTKEYYFLLKQETLYWNSDFLHKKWYRKLYGGKWTYLKLGKDTPNIGMFSVWTKLPDSFSGYKIVLDTEEYPETNVDSKLLLFKQFFINLFKK